MSVLFYDSGVGGIAVLREFLKIKSNCEVVYFADNAYIPYGTKSKEELVCRAKHNISELINEEQLDVVVLACNTLTAAAVCELRKKFVLPIVGIQPAVKPALTAHSEKVYLFGTDLTAKAYENCGAKVCAMSDLAEIVEKRENAEMYIKMFMEKEGIKSEDVKGAILGCTHYSLVRDSFRKNLPQTEIYDGCIGTARRAVNIYEGITRENKMGDSQKEENGRVKLRLSYRNSKEIQKYVEIIYQYSCVKSIFCV